MNFEERHTTHPYVRCALDEGDILSKSHLKRIIPVLLPLLKIFLEMCLESDT